MERKFWPLLVIAAGGDSGLTPVQLQKTLFLLATSCPNAVASDSYQFEPYDYGPFDSSVYRDTEELASEGLVSILPVPGRSWRQYVVTPAGVEVVETVRQGVPPDIMAYLQEVVTWAKGLSFSQLVKAIYARYPEYRVNSVFQY